MYISEPKSLESESSSAREKQLNKKWPPVKSSDTPTDSLDMPENLQLKPDPGFGQVREAKGYPSQALITF